MRLGKVKHTKQTGQTKKMKKKNKVLNKETSTQTYKCHTERHGDETEKI